MPDSNLEVNSNIHSVKKYFKGLDSLRAIAALVVVIGHIEQLKSINKIPLLFEKSFFTIPDAHIGVILFFVISGFLITYLLIKEREKNGKILFGAFYMRRILRIWPLYYLILIISFLLFRVDYKMSSIILSFSIFPNIALSLGSVWPTSPQIWSIGVEEQFYLFWPILLSLIPEKKMVTYLIGFFVVFSILPHALSYICVRNFRNVEVINFINSFAYSTKFNCMALGAVLGFMYAKDYEVLKYLKGKFIAYSSFVLSFLFWFSGVHFQKFTDEFYTLLFGIMILNITTNSELKLNMESKIFNFLGRISYGIYMYHWIIILLVLKYMPYNSNCDLNQYNAMLYILVLSGTVLVSWVSFNSFEKYFLKLKTKYEINN